MMNMCAHSPAFMSTVALSGRSGSATASGGVLPPLRHRGRDAHLRRPASPRQAAHRPDRRTRHPLGRIPDPAGRPQRALPPYRRQRLHHPVVGDLDLTYEGLDLPADPGWHLFTFTAAPGNLSGDRLRLLASWAVTLERETPAATPPMRTLPKMLDLATSRRMLPPLTLNLQSSSGGCVKSTNCYVS
jgi:hypothetical protein